MWKVNLRFRKEQKEQKKIDKKTTTFEHHNGMQHRLTANSGHSSEKCYFRDQLTINKTDKFASLHHATCVKQDRCLQ